MNRTVKWIALGVVLVGTGALLVWAFLGGRAELAREREREEPVKVPPRVTRTAQGDMVVTLDPETQARIGLNTQQLNAETLQPEIAAYGRLQEDPALSFIVRAPVAGTLRLSANRDWPSLGETLPDRVQFGLLEPRLAPLERVDVNTRVSVAQADVQSDQAELSAAQAAWERARILNADAKNISDRALQDAEARVKISEAKLDAARQNVKALQAVLAASADTGGLTPLSVGQRGEVVEVLARPNEAVESGQPLLRLARFDRLIARVDVPLGETIPRSVSRARIAPLGQDQTFAGERISLAAAVDSKTLNQGFLFRFSPRGIALRPGTAITAYLPVSGDPHRGVVIPRDAVVRYGGKAWAYVQVDTARFTRREVALEQPTDAGWFVASGMAPGDRIVVTGAQVLLSEETKSQIQILEEGENK